MIHRRQDRWQWRLTHPLFVEHSGTPGREQSALFLLRVRALVLPYVISAYQYPEEIKEQYYYSKAKILTVWSSDSIS